MYGKRFQGVCGCLPRVRSRSVLCVPVCSCAFSSRLLGSRGWGGCLLVSRPVYLVGGAGWRLSPACLCSFVLRCGRCLPSRPVLSSRLFATGSGELGASGVSSCLLGIGAGVDVRRLVPVFVAVRLLTQCRSVRRGRMSDEDMAAAGCHRVPAAACLPYPSRPVPRHDGTGSEAERMMTGCLGVAWEAVGADGLLACGGGMRRSGMWSSEYAGDDGGWLLGAVSCGSIRMRR